MIISYHRFHTSSRWLQRPDHPLYQVIDWSRVDAGHYAVVDPFDPHAILYLSEKAYQVQTRVSLSQDSSLIKLAGPGDRPVTSSAPPTSSDSSTPQNSPIHIGKSNAKLWKKFLSWHLSSMSRLGQKTNAKKGRSDSNKATASIALSAEVLRILIPYYGLDVHFRLGGEPIPSPSLVKTLREFADRMVTLLQGCGPQYLISYLKNSLFYVNKYAAGAPAHSYLLEPPVSVSRSGLPRIIPLLFRRRLHSKEKDPTIYRLITSLLNSFRAMEGTHEQQDLSSIRGPHPQLDEQTLKEFKLFCKEEFWPKIVKSYLPSGKEGLITNVESLFTIQSDHGVYIPLKAGPNANPGLLGAQVDAVLWNRRARQGLPNYIHKWCLHVGDHRTLEVFFGCLGSHDAKYFSNEYYSSPRSQYTLGKLQCLPEPAGKVRTIAIVDYWTQRIMSPVHDWMMRILSFLPTDGTFDQENATAQIARRHRITDKTAYSIDLKSATDLIPFELYEAVFTAVWQKKTVDLWKGLLTDRWFLIPEKEKLVKKDLRGCSIRYGRGQPMGTLSSWPSMALVHHALELFSAKKAGYDPEFFVDYAILGDDNVTLGTDVANAYVAVADKLCVPTSPAKTLSGDLFIFAQQIFLKGVNVSPLSLREELGIRTFGERLEMALRAIRRGWLDSELTIPRFLRLLITRGAYKRALRDWSVGVLGDISKSALVSAFGIASETLTELLGYRSSGFHTLLSSLRNKVSALAGDKGGQASPTSKRSGRSVQRTAHIERSLCILLAKETSRLLKIQRDSLDLSSIRFRGWGETIKDSRVLPFITDVPLRGKGNRAPELPGIRYPDKFDPSWHHDLVALEKDSALLNRMESSDTPGVYLFKRKYPNGRVITQPVPLKKFHRDFKDLVPQQIYSEATQYAHMGMWVVLYDSYKELFGSINESERWPTGLPLFTSRGYVLPSSGESYQDYEAEEEGYGGVGITDTPPHFVSSPITGNSTLKPRISIEVARAKKGIDVIIENLAKAENVPMPWAEVLEGVRLLSKVQRTPRFLSYADLYNLDTATKNNPLDRYVRLGKTLSHLLQFMPLDIPNWEISIDSIASDPVEGTGHGVVEPNPLPILGHRTNQGLLTEISTELAH